jgi:hypothetical protein
MSASLLYTHIKDVSKTLGQTAKASCSHHNQEKRSQQHVSGNQGFLSPVGINMLLGCISKTKRLRKHIDIFILFMWGTLP